jgi:arylsulfatase A-like enzyme
MRRFADVFLLGVAAAIATGLLHALGLAVSHLGFDRMTWYPRGFFWMSPVAYALVMLPGALLLGLIALTIRKPWVLALSAFAVATVGAFGLLLPSTAISRVAALVLAAGVGSVFSRAVMKRSDRWLSWARGLVFAGVVGVPVAALVQGRSPRGSEADASAGDRPPNILLVVMDVVRASNVTLNQPELSTTPGLARRGAEGVVFEWAFSTAPWTLPSHASMLTGLYARQQDGDWYKPLQDEARTLTETLRDRGYATGGFVANLHYTAWDTGLAQGFDHFEDYARDWLQVIRCSSYTQTTFFTSLLDAKGVGDVVRAFVSPNLSIVPQHTYRTKLADRVTGDFLRWQDGLGGRPFFALINLMDGHLPWFEPEPLKSRYPPPVHHDLRAYDASIRFMDAQLDSLFLALARRNELDRTIVVVTSDHGELFEQHGLSGHANSLYLDLLHVPLMIRYPARVPANVRVVTPVSLRDLSATLVDLSGGTDSFPGASLRNAWAGQLDRLSPLLAEVTKLPNPAETPASQGNMRSLLDDSLHYIVNEGTRREELYAYRADPAEARNLFEGDSARLQAWRDRLARVLQQVARPNDQQ